HGAPIRTAHPEDQRADADDAADRALHALQPEGTTDSADADGPGAHDQSADGASPAVPSRSTNPDRYHFPTAADARAKLAPVPPAAATIHLHLIMTDRTL